MEKTEAADIIDSISSDICTNPAQFHIHINITGQQITANGGSGQIINVTGGGPGSNTIGNIVSLENPDIQMELKQRGVQALDEHFNSLVISLKELSEQLRKSTPDRSRIKQLCDSLINSWVPSVISGVVVNVVSKSLGL